MMSEAQPAKPKLGSQPRSTESATISMRPSQKFGMARSQTTTSDRR
jgi:hypothetical protein